MNVSELKEGQRAFFMVDLEDQRTWKACHVMAVSSHGYMLEFESNGELVKQWFDVRGEGAALRFRQQLDFFTRWQHKNSRKLYELTLVSKASSHVEGFEPTVVFKCVESGELYAAPAKQFNTEFVPHASKSGVPF